MKTAIMQPYFLPYIGYWQLIYAVDFFIIYDDVNFIKGGWINRNYLLLNQVPHLFTVSLDQASPYKLINEITIKEDSSRKKLLLKIHSAYCKAPLYKDVMPIIEKMIFDNETKLSVFIGNSIRTVLNYLNLNKEIVYSSNINKNDNLKGQDKIINICKKIKTTEYINLMGGKELYNKNDFEKDGLKLSFIRSGDIVYKQFNNAFIPNLSILDILMFNNKDKVIKLLENYFLE